MKVFFDYLSEFEHRAKVLRKKYPSFVKDYEAFLDELENLRSLIEQIEEK